MLLGFDPEPNPDGRYSFAWNGDASDSADGTEIERQGGISSFLNLALPLLSDARTRVERTAEVINSTLVNRLIGSGVVDSLMDALYEQLLVVLLKPLTLELRISILDGDPDTRSPVERFRKFGESLRCRDVRERIFSQYPVLLRNCTRACNYWVSSVSEFLERTASDLHLLMSTFGASGELKVASISSGDAHNNGRRVIIATFSNGCRVVYKPRPMKAARKFQDLLVWVDSRASNRLFRVLRVHDLGSYGWIEHVESSGCDSIDDVGEFYRRIGALLCVLYAVRATDAHFENVIASGAFPVLVDVETIFQPEIRGHCRSSINGLAESALEHSVLAVGLLPSPILIRGELIDMSGLGAKSEQATPLSTMGFVGGGTDDMRVDQVQYRLGKTFHLPMLHGEVCTVSEHVNSVMRGFSETYQLIQSIAGELTDINGPILAFSDCQVRVLLRPTATYASLLQESYHPLAISDGTETDMVLAQIWGVEGRDDEVDGAVLHEFNQLRNGDIPLFLCVSSERTVTSLDGQPAGPVAFMSGVDAVVRRVVEMSEKDLELQGWIVRASIGCLNEPVKLESNRSVHKDDGRPCCPSSEAMRSLVATSVIEGERSSWLTMAELVGNNGSIVGYRMIEVGIDLYDGIAGIVFFLFGYSAHRKGEAVELLARQALRELDRRVSADPGAHELGAFTGLCGVIYAYAHIAHWNPSLSAGLQAKARQLLDAVEKKLVSDTSCDLISGRAGVILCLLAAYRAWNDSRYLDVAVRCGEDMGAWLGTAAAQESSHPHLPYWRGMSHGYAGVLLAMAALASASRCARMTRIFREMSDLESALVANGEWTDPDDSDHKAQATWCHGVPGIAMARLATSSYVHTPLAEHRAREALQRCLAVDLLDNDSLCHGMLGNIDVFVHATTTFPDESVWRDVLRGRVSEMESSISAHGVKCARPHSTSVPGLMTGIAGIGYQFLRTGLPEQLPSVLTLDPPTAR